MVTGHMQVRILPGLLMLTVNNMEPTTMTNKRQDRHAPGSAIRSLREIQVGDEVFIAHQKRRHESEQKTERKPVVKVGRKYGYLREGYLEQKFDLETGISVHNPDSNARVNGFGFDVYLSEDDYFAEQSRNQQRKRLQERLVTNFGRLVDLPSGVVNEIHRILDDAGVN